MTGLLVGLGDVLVGWWFVQRSPKYRVRGLVNPSRLSWQSNQSSLAPLMRAVCDQSTTNGWTTYLEE